MKVFGKSSTLRFKGIAFAGAALALTAGSAEAKPVLVAYLTFTGGEQTWTAPTAGTYEIDAFGGAGGPGVTTFGHTLSGPGGEVGGDFHLSAGTELDILVAGRGVAAPVGGAISTSGGGGGGASLVYAGGTLLEVAGGGGGGGTASDGDPGGGLNNGDGLGGRGSSPGLGGTSGAGGQGGGWSGGWNGGGGSGLSGDGGDGLGPDAGEGAVTRGGGAGVNGANGGIGGGGGGGLTGGGGGGGYSGGGGGGGDAGFGGGGGAGGSFIDTSATNPAFGNGVFSANGLVEVFASAPEPGAWAMMLIGFGAIGGVRRLKRSAAA